MGERKIIVNKCDVSGCEFYCHYTDNCLDYKLWYDKPLCKNLPDCHYKQLKRKEQECEELRKIIDEAKNSKLDLKSFLIGEAIQNEYEQQLDQLKAQLLDQEAETLKAGGIIHTLEQTLTEIKEIAENFYNTGFFRVDNDCILINNNACVETLEKILQKISEVEDETSET